MTDRFLWHPRARLLNATGQEVPPGPAAGAVPSEGAEGLASVIGLPTFRIGAGDAPAPDPGDVPVFETLTSGSTGGPRRIRRTQASWIASFALNLGFGIGPGARVAVLGRLVQSLSLYAAVEGLHLGAEVHLLDTLRPDRQLLALAARRITHLYATPAQLRLLADQQGSASHLQLVLVGGSKLDAGLRQRLAAVAPSATLLEFYGAAETSFVSLAGPDTPAGSVGRAYPGVEISVDPTGEIWVRSPYLFLGYAGDTGDTGGARWRGGWLSVGEIGQIENGCLFLKGRAGRMVTVADQNVFPEEIETYMESLPGIVRAAVLPVPDDRRGAVLVAMVQGDPAVEMSALAALRRQLGPLRAPKALLWQGDWPVLPSGKTDFRALQARLAWPG